MTAPYAEVIGYLVSEDEAMYWLASWVYDRQANNSNTEVFGIVKSCVVEKKKLKFTR